MNYLALDLGAGSGRAMLGNIANGSISMEEIHRFTNRQVRLGDTLYWDFLALFAELKHGVALTCQTEQPLAGIAVDTWGVDFGLLGEDGQLLSNPVCYRDARTKGILEDVFALIGANELYKATGPQLMEINTAFQLLTMQQGNSPLLHLAKHLLFMPDLINYFLTGRACNEYTIASTSQLLDPETKQWSPLVLSKLRTPEAWMQPIVFPGTRVGQLQPDIALETGVGKVDAIAVGSHDTASAVAAIPASGSQWAFLSSGTWSLMGVETDRPILTEEAMLGNFTNEGGVDGKILFMRNIAGLWLLQCLVKEWELIERTPIQYESLLAQAAITGELKSLVDPDDPSFYKPTSMEAAIATYCKAHHQPVPHGKREYVRCVVYSLAMKYSFVMTDLIKVSGRQIDTLYVVGGGGRNQLLNQCTANALGLKVVVGPVEATALGNVVQQAIAKSEIETVAQGRQLIASSFSAKVHLPEDTEKWKDAALCVKHLFNK